MKKIIALILCFLMVVMVFSACSKAPVNNEETNGSEISQDVVNNNDVEEDTSNEETEKKEENIKPDDKLPVANNTVATEKPQKNELPLSEIISGMVNVIPKDEHNLELIPAELYKDIYGIDKNNFDDVIIYGTMISVKANEIILIKVKNESEIQNAVNVLNQRKEQVYKTWEQYLPDQFEMVKNGVIKTNGKYAALIISPNVKDVVNKFNSLTK